MRNLQDPNSDPNPKKHDNTGGGEMFESHCRYHFEKSCCYAIFLFFRITMRVCGISKSVPSH